MKPESRTYIENMLLRDYERIERLKLKRIWYKESFADIRQFLEQWVVRWERALSEKYYLSS